MSELISAAHDKDIVHVRPLGLMQATSPPEAFCNAVMARDSPALERALTDDASMRALLPMGLREYGSREEIVAAFESWFASAVDFAPELRPVEVIGARVRVGWLARLRWETDGPPLVIEQTAIVDSDEAGVYGISLLCTGFQETEPSVPIAA